MIIDVAAGDSPDSSGKDVSARHDTQLLRAAAEPAPNLFHRAWRMKRSLELFGGATFLGRFNKAFAFKLDAEIAVLDPTGSAKVRPRVNEAEHIERPQG